MVQLCCWLDDFFVCFQTESITEIGIKKKVGLKFVLINKHRVNYVCTFFNWRGKN